MAGNALNEGGWVSSCEEGGRERPCPSDEGSDRGTGAEDAGGPAVEAMQARCSFSRVSAPNVVRRHNDG